ncbi:MAG TPA: UvrD-helicase domain-containing protein [Pirellulaceae bacterium]|nr:UvrD-helicase domain-containing protein [Pirellulaceae bacterium]
MNSELLASLTPAQRAAAEHINGPLLILAGPGSGKTRVVTHRVANLIENGVSSYSILALTFTNKAADEMRARLERLVPHERVWMGTFHRFCARTLRDNAALVGLRENFSIYDMDDSGKVLKQAIAEVDIQATHVSTDGLASAISWAKNSLILPEEYEGRPGSPLGSIVARVYPKYQQMLLTANAVDFDDLLLHVATLLKQNPMLRADLDERFKYILVDEYQDTNLAQYAIVRALSIDYPNLAVTGDPDQSIYGWRGANLNNILDFERDFPSVKTVRLEKNYRSTKAILRVADALITHNVRRKAKDLYTDNAEGAPVRLATYATQREEAEQIAARIAEELHSGQRQPSDFAIFYRVNALSRALEHALREHGIHYQIVNGLEFYQRKEIKDVIAYLRLINNPRDNMALERIINVPTRGIGKSTLDKLRAQAFHYGAPLLDIARQSGMIAGLAKKSAISVAKFVTLIDRLTEKATAPVEEILGHLLTETGYRELLATSEAEEDLERLANIEELLTAAREFDAQHPGDGHLQEFLEQSALASDTDAFEAENNKVTMMTMHAAKGLEFPVVFIIAVEEGLIPHERSLSDSDKLEEERRLLFVGITRAEEVLQLSYVERRNYRGRELMPIPSSFLMELPRPEMELVTSTSSFFRDSSWDDSDHGDSYEGDEASQLSDFDDLDFLQDAPVPKLPVKAPAGMKTAAEMLASAAAAPQRFPTSAFRQGMIVQHPQYGSGVIVALSGPNHTRTATVRFYSAVGEKKFRLAHSPLTPVQSDD